MGAGNRIEWFRTDGSVALGIGISRFPYALTIGLTLILWHVNIGLGKPYTD